MANSGTKCKSNLGFRPPLATANLISKWSEICKI